MDEEKTEEELELETLEVETMLVEAGIEADPILSPDHFTSRQRAHEMKIVKFLVGGEF